MKKKNWASYVVAMFVCAFVFVISACSGEEIAGSMAVDEIMAFFDSHDYDGYSVMEVKTEPERYRIDASLVLDKKRITVEKSQLGQAKLTSESELKVEDLSDADSVRYRVSKTFSWSNTQKATFIGVYAAKKDAKEYYKLDDVIFSTQDVEMVDESGNLATITPHFVVYWSGVGSKVGKGSTELKPRYYEVAEGVKDISVVKHDYEGYSTGDIIGDDEFSAGIVLNLFKNRVEVDAEKLGKLQLVSEGNPNTTDLAIADSIGVKGSKGFSFDDGQQAEAIWRYAYAKAARSHAEIVDVNYIDYATEKIDEEHYKIIPHFRVFYRRIGEGAVSGSFDLYPWYTQVAKAKELSYEVEEYFETDEADNSMNQYLEVVITRSDGKQWTKRFRNALCGHVDGLLLFVRGTEIVDRRYTEFDETTADVAGVTTDGPWTLNKSCHTWRYETDFTSDTGGRVGPRSELRFIVTDIYFEDPETGWTYSRKFTRDCKMTGEEIKTVSGKQQTMTENNKQFKYGGTHMLSVECQLDGKLFHKSTANSDLYVEQ